MKIVDRMTFLNLPKGTIFSKYEPEMFYGLEYKVDDPDDYDDINIRSDFWSIPLVNGHIREEYHKEGDYMGNSISDYDHFEFDLDCGGRDGLYEEKQLFAIYEKEDILQLIGRLTYSHVNVSDD